MGPDHGVTDEVALPVGPDHGVGDEVALPVGPDHGVCDEVELPVGPDHGVGDEVADGALLFPVPLQVDGRRSNQLLPWIGSF